MENFLITGERVLMSVPFFALIAFLLFAGKKLFDFTTSYQFDEELTSKDNPAFGVTIAGFLVSLAIVLGGATFGAGEGSSTAAFVSLLVYGVLSIVLLRLSIVVNDRLILPAFSVHKEIIEDRNVGTAFVVAGSCVATALILAGALTGESVSFFRGIADLLVYWAVGQALLVAAGRIFQAITSYDIHQTIEHDDNAAAGLSFGGFLVGAGIIGNAALKGASSNLLEEIVTAAVLATTGLLLLIATRTIVDKALLPRSPLSVEVAQQKNLAAGAVAASSFMALSWVYSVAVTF